MHLQVLLENGADIDAISNDGESPLRFASQSGHLPVVQVRRESTVCPWLSSVQILVEAGASITIENDQGETPYDVIYVQEEAECSETTQTSLETILSSWTKILNHFRVLVAFKSVLGGRELKQLSTYNDTTHRNFSCIEIGLDLDEYVTAHAPNTELKSVNSLHSVAFRQGC